MADLKVPTPESSDALVYIGFAPSTANEIFQRYQNRPYPTQCPDSLLDYAFGHISILNTPRFADVAPRVAVTRVGLTQRMQDALMDPCFTDLFWTESLLYWIKDTLRINYHTLCQMNRSTGGHASENLVTSKSKPVKVVATTNIAPRDYPLLSRYTAVEPEGPLLPDHIALYRGISPAEAMEGEWIHDDGTVNMCAIGKQGGGDFNYNKTACYWTPEKEVAERYRQWVARRCPRFETWLIRIQIPIQFVNTLKKQDTWYSADWKEYVWHCKKHRLPPTKFDSLWIDGATDIVRGHICTGVTAPITRRKLEDIQTSMNIDTVLVYGPNNVKATQWMFMQGRSIEQMGEAIRGKIHIEITASIQVPGED